MYLETERMIVRDFTTEDGGDLYDILGDAETMKNCEPAYSMEKTERFLREFCIDRQGGVAAVLKETQKVIGYILFARQETGVYEMGWFFNRHYWHRGYAYEACYAVVEHAFSELCAHKIFAETIDGIKSTGLMKKIGMKQEGVQREQVKDSSGNWADFYFYGILRSDWEMGHSERAGNT